MKDCQSCKSFLPISDDQGLCRRYPPVPIATPEGTFAQFPPMLNEGWCGEHKTKDQEQ